MSNKLNEIKGLTDKNIMLFIGFWSNRGNVEHSDTINIQSDMLFYLNALMYYKQQADEMGKALEWANRIIGSGLDSGSQLRYDPAAWNMKYHAEWKEQTP